MENNKQGAGLAQGCGLLTPDFTAPTADITSAAGLCPPLHHSQILSLTLPHTPGHIYFNFEFPQPSVPNPVSAQGKISTNVYQFKRTHAYFP